VTLYVGDYAYSRARLILEKDIEIITTRKDGEPAPAAVTS
jgi:hypothetical protein